MINLTVFCSSKDNINNDFHLEIQNFIKLLDVNKFNIVYGGGTCGLMGTVRKTFIESVASRTKFDLGSERTTRLLTLLKDAPQGEACSNVTDINYWSELIDKIFELVYLIKKSGFDINYINLGGGIGIDYKTGIPIDLKSLAERVAFNTTNYNLITPIIYMENGRFITGPYGYLLAKCNVVKKLYDKTFYGLDACMSNLMRPGMYNSYHHISIFLKNNSILKSANVVGTLCENNDWFAKDRMLPVAEAGDIFIIWDTGAHAHSMGFQYNGKLRAPEIAIYDHTFLPIRRRETFDDYISTVIFNL